MRTVLLLSVGLLLTLSAVLGWPWLDRQWSRHRALELVRQGRFADAEPLLRRTLTGSPNDLEIVKALALGELESGKTKEADLSLARWGELAPQDIEPWQRRFELHLQSGQDDEALAEAHQLVEMQPGDPELGQKAVMFFLSRDRSDEALWAARRCLLEHPGHPQLRYLLAEALHAKGDVAETQAVLTPLVREYPSLTSALMLQALLLEDEGRSAEAIPLLRKVAVLDQARQQVARYHLGLALARTGQEEEAKRYLSEVNWLQVKKRLVEDRHPENPELQSRLAEGLLGSGQAEEARRVLEKVLERNPDYTFAHRLLASYYEKNGQPAKAAEHRRQAGK
jgi:Flp pilus assembly protein TadD